MIPRHEVELLCPPLRAPDGRINEVVALLESALGERMAYEFTPYAEFRPVRDLAAHIADSFVDRRWEDPTLILVNGRGQEIIAYISMIDGQTVGPMREQGRWDGAMWMAMGIPWASYTGDLLSLLLSLGAVAEVEIGTVGPVVKRMEHSSALFSNGDPARVPLAWHNVWSARVADYHGFPGPGDDEHLVAIRWSPQRTQVAFTVTADPLDANSPEHRGIIAWFDARFGIKSPLQS